MQRSTDPQSSEARVDSFHSFHTAAYGLCDIRTCPRSLARSLAHSIETHPLRRRPCLLSPLLASGKSRSRSAWPARPTAPRIPSTEGSSSPVRFGLGFEERVLGCFWPFWVLGLGSGAPVPCCSRLCSRSASAAWLWRHRPGSCAAELLSLPSLPPRRKHAQAAPASRTIRPAVSLSIVEQRSVESIEATLSTEAAPAPDWSGAQANLHSDASNAPEPPDTGDRAPRGPARKPPERVLQPQPRAPPVRRAPVAPVAPRAAPRAPPALCDGHATRARRSRARPSQLAECRAGCSIAQFRRRAWRPGPAAIGGEVKISSRSPALALGTAPSWPCWAPDAADAADAAARLCSPSPARATPTTLRTRARSF